MTEKHLWEVDHAYYCNEGNYYAREQPVGRYDRWQDFLDEEGDSDFDMNLVFRWDWKEGDGEYDDEEAKPFNGDANYRNGLLYLFIMGQRKGLYRWAEIQVCRADEDSVRAYLQPRFEHLVALWEPFTLASEAR